MRNVNKAKEEEAGEQVGGGEKGWKDLGGGQEREVLKD